MFDDHGDTYWESCPAWNTWSNLKKKRSLKMQKYSLNFMFCGDAFDKIVRGLRGASTYLPCFVPIKVVILARQS